MANKVATDGRRIFPVTVIAGLAGALLGWAGGSAVAPAFAGENALADHPMIGSSLALLGADAPGARELGAAIGLAIGIVVALALYGKPRNAGSLALRGLLAAVIASGTFYGAAAASDTLFDSIGLNLFAPVVEFEVRVPTAGTLPAARDDIQFELHTDRNQIIAELHNIQRDGERPILRGSVPLKFRTTDRQIVMSLPGEPVRVFRIRLPARTSSSPDFGPWQQVDFSEGADRRAEASADYAIRFRVN